MKKYFLTGLVILLPVVLTIVIVRFLVNILTKPFVGVVSNALDYYGILNKQFLFFNEKQMLITSSKIIILVGLLLLAVLVGMLTRLVFIKYIARSGDFILHRIPVIKTIYKSTQDVMTTLLVKDETQPKVNFSKVVLVPFPHSKAYTMGLITNPLIKDSNVVESDTISVFVPGTPNPAMGFMLLFARDKVIPVNLRVEDALKFIVSCGVICPSFTAVNPQEMRQDLSGD